MARDEQVVIRIFSCLPNKFAITLEEGNVMQEHTRFREVPFKDYLQQIEHSQDGQSVGYLSVFEIFNQFPALVDDVDFEIISRYKLRNHVSGWIGPAGTVTGYHIDWADNLFAQIRGRKLLKLVSPKQRRWMYPSRKYDSNTLMSSVNTDAFDESLHPEFTQVEALYAVLEPGDMVFIPRAWWHYVRSLSPSISVNNFGVDWKGIIRDKPREYARKYLHRLGLYGRECTCHMVQNGRRIARG